MPALAISKKAETSRRSPARPVRVTPGAEEDFGELPPHQREMVLDVFRSPFRPEKTRRLRSRGSTRLRRIRVDDIRIVIANRPHDHTDYVWRIRDRKDIYRILKNLDSRTPFTGISIVEFVMKHNGSNQRQQGLIPPASTPTSAPTAQQLSSTAAVPNPAAVAAPAGLASGPGPIASPVRDGSLGAALLEKLSTYIGLTLCEDLAAAKAILREDVARLESDVKEYDDWINFCAARQSELEEQTERLARDLDGVSGLQRGLSETVGDVRGRIDAVTDRFDALSMRLDTLAVGLDEHGRRIGGRLDELAEVQAEDRQKSQQELAALAQKLDTLVKGVVTVGCLAAEVERNGVAMGGLERRLDRDLASVIDTLRLEIGDVQRSIEPLVAGLEAVRDYQARLRADLSGRTWSARLARTASWLHRIGGRRDR